MSIDNSFMAVKEAIGGGQNLFKKLDVLVETDAEVYIYRGVDVRVGYNIGYMQMEVDIDWDEDRTQPHYKTLGLHGRYNSNYQEFSCENSTLQWEDGPNKISIQF